MRLVPSLPDCENAMAVAGNLVPVTVGNIVGDAGGVAISYWVAYGPERPKA